MKLSPKTIVEHYERAYRVLIKDNLRASQHGKISYQKIVKATFKFIEEAYSPLYDSDLSE